MDSSDFSSVVKAELAFLSDIQEGARGMPVKRVQEWLTFHGMGTNIDSDFGSATKASVYKFQIARNLPATGLVDATTWSMLTEPMRLALKNGTGSSYGARVESIARQHLKIHPVELGGDNRGPWVRMYTGGDGPEWLWCAGFVTTILRQAAAELKCSSPIRGSNSCDSLAAQAKEAGLLVTEQELIKGKRSWEKLGETFIFLNRRSAEDWTHTGFGFRGTSSAFDTIEGNANHEGGLRSFEVCARTRSGVDKEYILLPDQA